MSANETQVGGTHYRNSFQHWDLCHELDLGYFEGQITKYITRHRFKKGQEDLDKAIHFTQKLRELAVTGGRQPRHKYGTVSMFTDYANVNKLVSLEMMCVMSACCWSTVDNLDILLDRLKDLHVSCYPQPHLEPAREVSPICVETSQPHRLDINGKCVDCGGRPAREVESGVAPIDLEWLADYVQTELDTAGVTVNVELTPTQAYNLITTLRALTDRAARPGAQGPEGFEQAWAKFEAVGFRYGPDALEQVRFGWEIAKGIEVAENQAAAHPSATERQQEGGATPAYVDQAKDI